MIRDEFRDNVLRLVNSDFFLLLNDGAKAVFMYALICADEQARVCDFYAITRKLGVEDSEYEDLFEFGFIKGTIGDEYVTLITEPIKTYECAKDGELDGHEKGC